jgi:hypothetical protein
MEITWKTYRICPGEGAWEAASYNIRTADGHEHGRWRSVLRKHLHGPTVISHYKAPPGKAWKIVGKPSKLGEEVYILEGAYYDAHGHVLAGPGTFMFNASGARHGGISCDLTLRDGLGIWAGRDEMPWDWLEQVSEDISPAGVSRT